MRTSVTVTRMVIAGAALREHKNTTIGVIPGAPHTLLNVPQARLAVEAWLRTTVGAGATK